MIEKHRHFIIHKPWGMISQFVNPAKRKKKLLGDLYDFPERTMAIGRLDVASEGLLFLTTDGKVSYEIRSNKYEKEYYVQVDGIINKEAVEKLKIPYLIIHGQKDLGVLPDEGKKLQSWNSTNELKLIESGDHTFSAKHPWKFDFLPKELKEVVFLTINFIKSNIKL